MEANRCDDKHGHTAADQMLATRPDWSRNYILGLRQQRDGGGAEKKKRKLVEHFNQVFN